MLGGRKLFATCALSALLVSASAAAEPSAADVRVANTLYKTGQDEAAKEHWEQARDAFARAYALYPQPIILANLAGAEVKTGAIVAGVEHYRQCLKRAGELKREEVTAVERAMKLAESRLAHVRIHVSATTAADKVEIDGAVLPPAALGVDYPVDPGRHAITTTRPGWETSHVAVTLAEGASETVTIVLQPKPDAPPPPPTPSTERPPERSIVKSPWFWIVTGVVVVGATTATLCVTVFCRADDPYSGNVPSVKLP